jgi:hydrogenase expression/formation protein HypC
MKECHDDVCITCSDIAQPFRITELRDDDLALVDTGAGLEEVSVGLVRVSVGDVVLVHAKEAIAVVAGESSPHTGRAAQPEGRE